MDVNAITASILASGIEVHRELGPGLLESVYQRCLAIELRGRGHRVETEIPIPVMYKGNLVQLDGFRVDVMVDDAVVVELKSVGEIIDLHKKQLLTYLKLTGKQVGLLLNFNQVVLKDGIFRIANGFKA